MEKDFEIPSDPKTYSDINLSINPVPPILPSHSTDMATELGFEHFEQYNRTYFYNRDKENKLCIDCQSSFPSFISINHGIIICESCAEVHRSLGYNISYIRNINDEWDGYLVSFMLLGGNNRFKRFCIQHDLLSIPIKQKYLTRICEYYRLLLKSEVLSEEPPSEIPKDNILDPISNEEEMMVHYFPEFRDYKLYEGSEKEKTLVEKVKDGFSGEIIKDSLKVGINGVYGTGKFVVETTVPVVKFVGRSAFKGLGMAFNYIAGRNEKEEMRISENKLYDGGNYFAQGSCGGNEGKKRSEGEVKEGMWDGNVIANKGEMVDEEYEMVDKVQKYEKKENEYFNSDKGKARKAANNFLLKH